MDYPAWYQWNYVKTSKDRRMWFPKDHNKFNICCEYRDDFVNKSLLCPTWPVIMELMVCIMWFTLCLGILTYHVICAPVNAWHLRVWSMFVDYIIKTHVRGFFDTDLHEVSWHFATPEAVKPSGRVLSSTDRVKISVKEGIQSGFLFLSHT